MKILNRPMGISFLLALTMVMSLFVNDNMKQVKAATIIDSIQVTFHWDKVKGFELGGTLDALGMEEGCVTVPDSVNYQASGYFFDIKATKDHVKSGYITQEMLDDSREYTHGWIHSTDYSGEYKINKEDTYAYWQWLISDEGYWFDNERDNTDVKHKVVLTGEKVSLATAMTTGNRRGQDNSYVDLWIELGTGAEIDAVLNPPISKPNTTPGSGAEKLETTVSSSDTENSTSSEVVSNTAATNPMAPDASGPVTSGSMTEPTSDTVTESEPVVQEDTIANESTTDTDKTEISESADNHEAQLQDVADAEAPRKASSPNVVVHLIIGAAIIVLGIAVVIVAKKREWLNINK